MRPRSPRPEEIYEALVDEDLFQALPQMLVEALGARSILLHWHHNDGSADILTHSGYFSDEQLHRYGTEFAELDPWAQATAGLQPDGIALDLEKLVSPEEFGRSRFFNDYIRPMGDDTFRCMGLRSDTRWGSGMIAVQRGRTQQSFSAAEVARLQAYVPHLRRLLVLRGRLTALERRASTTSAVVDAMRDAALVATADGRLVSANREGERLLSSGRDLRVRNGYLVARNVQSDQQLRQLIAAACAIEPQGGTILLQRGDWPPLVIAVAPLMQAAGARQALLIIHRSPSEKNCVEQSLRSLFGLTKSEAEISQRLADGLSVAEIADERRVSQGTLRGQIKSIFLKLGCSRQSEVVILVNSIPLLAS